MTETVEQLAPPVQPETASKPATSLISPGDIVASAFKRETGERDVVGFRAKAFLRQEYPLTEEGQKLRTLTEQALQRGDKQEMEAVVSQLPTVENPRLHLFKDFELTPEQEARIFGDLEDVQVTKGCSHKCDFCAAGSEASIQKMPFAAVLKIAEKKHEYDTKLTEARGNAEKIWDDWGKVRDGIMGKSQAEILEELTQWRQAIRANGGKAGWLMDFLKDKYKDALPKLEYAYEQHGMQFLMRGLSMDASFYDFNRIEGSLRDRDQITNYYDSDPFDYQDTAFPHEDGTPADYGDVFAALASEVRPVHITTAGWPRGRKIAQRAAEKIVKLVEENPDIIDLPRISVNKYEYRARADYGTYREDMENVIRSLEFQRGLPGHVLLFSNKENPEDAQFIQEVIDPIKKFVEESRGWQVLEPPISSFSGSIKDSTIEAESHHDVMACMPGIHIWPDGTIADQRYNWKLLDKGVEDGTRPTPTGEMLFEKRKS